MAPGLPDSRRFSAGWLRLPRTPATRQNRPCPAWRRQPSDRRGRSTPQEMPYPTPCMRDVGDHGPSTIPEKKFYIVRISTGESSWMHRIIITDTYIMAIERLSTRFDRVPTGDAGLMLCLRSSPRRIVSYQRCPEGPTRKPGRAAGRPAGPVIGVEPLC
jgi:hypothetical protein